MFNIKPIEIMKKTIIAIIAIISIITLNSCGNSAKEQHLLEMRDSIQAQLDWHTEAIEREFHELDSLYEVDRDMYGYSHESYMKRINKLQEWIDEDQEHLFQIELELNKK
jgi:hypothetical protein